MPPPPRLVLLLLLASHAVQVRAAASIVTTPAARVCCFGTDRPCECVDTSANASAGGGAPDCAAAGAHAAPVPPFIPCDALTGVPKDVIRDACATLLDTAVAGEKCATLAQRGFAHFSASFAPPAGGVQPSEEALRGLALLACRQAVDFAQVLEASTFALPNVTAAAAAAGANSTPVFPPAARRHACASLAAVGAGELQPRPAGPAPAAAEPAQPRPQPLHCWARYPEALPGIYDDLATFATSGITEAHVSAMRARLEAGVSRSSLSHDGAAFHIIDNKLYGEAGVNWTHVPSAMYAVHLNMLLKQYSLPDVSLFITVSDHSDQSSSRMAPVQPAALPLLPVLRSCKARDTGDILLPSYAYYEDRAWRPDYVAPEVLARPWDERENAVYAAYHGAICEASALDGELLTTRMDEHGKRDTCARASLARWTNASYMTEPHTWAVEPRINVDHTDVRTWGRYRYIAHMEGVTCSNKLEKVAMQGSLLFIEETGYVDSLHRMMRPWVSYVPFYRLVPQELRDVVNFVAARPALARSIAADGARIGRTYGSLDGLGCQLMMLVTEMGKLMRFKPAELLHSANVTLMPYEQYMLWAFSREFNHKPARLAEFEQWLLNASYTAGWSYHV